MAIAPELANSGPVPSEFRIRSLTASMFVPNLLFSIGQGVVVPVIALLALELGASPAMAGVIVALRGLGTMVFDLPAGVLVSRFGEKRAMILSGAILGVVSGLISVTGSIWTYAALTTAMGFTWSVWVLARIAFATAVTPTQYRGRVMSSIGGMYRIGLLIGPIMASWVIARWGLSASFLLMAVLAFAASLSILVARVSTIPRTSESGSQGRATTGNVVRTHRRVLVTAGTVAVTSQMLRSSREALVPLWGSHIGVAIEIIPLVFAASAAVESLLFYPVGMLMDRRGRKWSAIPAMVLFTIGVLAVPLTDDALSLTVVGIVMGLANGLGTGMNMTLGSDLSPLWGRSQFLAVWRLLSDAGTAGGPLLIAFTTTVAGLAASAVVIGAFGAVGAVVLWRLVPETLDR